MWKPGSEGSLKDASEAREAAENQVPVSGSCGRARGKKDWEKKKEGQTDKHWKPQTELTELIDGDEREEDG